MRAEPGGPQHMDGEGSSVNLNSSQLAGIYKTICFEILFSGGGVA